jgi:hypothetical protein
MKLKIVAHDRDGYNGRELPPSSADIGQVVLVLGLNTAIYTIDGDYAGPSLTASGVATDTTVTEDNVEYCWPVLTTDGRTLELMDHEVEVVHRQR